MDGSLAHLKPRSPVLDLRAIPMPPMGAKCWVLERKGLFLLADTPGTLRTIAITHAGSGALIIYDGIPDEEGLFPDEHMPESDPLFLARNGRPIYKANPVVMGSWMLDAGFSHGLTLRAMGGHDPTAAIASVVWMPFKAQVRK
jgi:hypothetical protein